MSFVPIYLMILQVFEGHNLETPNTFYVQGQQKSIELHTRLDISVLCFPFSVFEMFHLMLGMLSASLSKSP